MDFNYRVYQFLYVSHSFPWVIEIWKTYCCSQYVALRYKIPINTHICDPFTRKQNNSSMADFSHLTFSLLCLHIQKATHISVTSKLIHDGFYTFFCVTKYLSSKNLHPGLFVGDYGDLLGLSQLWYPKSFSKCLPMTPSQRVNYGVWEIILYILNPEQTWLTVFWWENYKPFTSQPITYWHFVAVMFKWIKTVPWTLCQDIAKMFRYDCTISSANYMTTTQCIYAYSQDELLMFVLSIRMGKKGHLTNIECGRRAPLGCGGIIVTWRMFSRQICNNCLMFSCQYGRKSVRNVSSTFFESLPW